MLGIIDEKICVAASIGVSSSFGFLICRWEISSISIQYSMHATGVNEEYIGEREGHGLRYYRKNNDVLYIVKFKHKAAHIL